MIQYKERRPIISESGDEQRGILICNIPVGKPDCVCNSLDNIWEIIHQGFASVIDLILPRSWPGKMVPLCQIMWLLTILCMRFKGDYLIRHVRPYLLGKFTRTVNSGVHDLGTLSLWIQIERCTEIFRERLCLRMGYHGCGLRQDKDHRHVQFLGALLQVVPLLLDRKEGPQRESVSSREGCLSRVSNTS